MKQEQIQFREKLLDYCIEKRAEGETYKDIKQDLINMFQATEGQIINTFKKYCEWKQKINEDKSLDKLADAQNNLMIKQKVLVKQRNLLNNDANILAFRNLLLEAFKDNLFIDESNYPITLSKEIKDDDDSVVYIIADEHFRGKKDIPHLNKMFSLILKDIKDSNINNYSLAFLGDGIDGIIHTGAISSNDGAIEPLIEYTKILLYWINIIKPSNLIYVSTSNHTQTRPLGSNRNEFAREDLNLVIIEMLKQIYPNILYGDIITFKDMCFFHGHQSWAKTKEKIIENFVKIDLDPKLIFMGHFHNFKVNNYGKDKWLVCCPAVKNFNNDWDKDNAFYNQSRILKINYEYGEPTFNIIKL